MNKLQPFIVCAALLCTLPATAQTNEAGGGSPLSPVAETTLGWLKGSAAITNWTVVGYGSFSDMGSGAGILALYHPTRFVGVGLGGDYFIVNSAERGDFTMTSGNLSLQLPVDVGPTRATFYTIGGIGIPLGGAGANNGDTALIGGTGVSFSFQVSERWSASVGCAAVYWERTGVNDGWRYCPTVALKLNF